MFQVHQNLFIIYFLLYSIFESFISFILFVKCEPMGESKVKFDIRRKEELSVPRVILKDGIECPMIGLGTWRSPVEVTKQAVMNAIDVGYRHIDCAHVYGNEHCVGEALAEKIEEGRIERADMFITSKLWNTFHKPENVRAACELSLAALQTTYLDLYLMHWPMGYKDGKDLYPKDEDGKLIYADTDYVNTWTAMEQLVDAGLCRSIGVSNFNQWQLQRLLIHAKKPIAVLQVECHPYLNQKELMKYCHLNDIVMTAYSPLGSPHSPYKKPGQFPLLQHPEILKIAKKHERSAAQILIAYQVHRGNIVIPRSIDAKHIAANLKAHRIQLTKNDIATIDGLDCDGRFMTMESATGHRYHPFECNEYQLKLF